LYGNSEITDSAVLYSHPQTSSVSAYNMQTMEIIEKDGMYYLNQFYFMHLIQEMMN